MVGKKQLQAAPFVLTYFIVGGRKAAIANELRGLDPWDAEFGMSVKAVWKPRDERQGTATDWHF